jgi:hypothetical protein
MTTREHYYVSNTTGDVTTTLLRVALDYLRPQIYLAIIDMFPDLADLEPNVEFAEEDIAAYNLLRAVAQPSEPRRRRTWMAERLDLTNDQTFEAYKIFGYHSIHTQAYRRDDPPESGEYPEAVAAIDNHDQGNTIGIRVTEAERQELRGLLEKLCWPWEELLKWEPKEKKRWFRRRSINSDT